MISFWLACLHGLCPGSFDGDLWCASKPFEVAGRRVTGGLALGPGALMCQGSGEASCMLPCTDLSVAQLHSLLGNPWLQTLPTCGLTYQLIHLSDCIQYIVYLQCLMIESRKGKKINHPGSMWKNLLTSVVLWNICGWPFYPWYKWSYFINLIFAFTRFHHTCRRLKPLKYNLWHPWSRLKDHKSNKSSFYLKEFKNRW